MMQPQDPRSLKRIRMLIVDDMPDMAQNVQKLLHFERDIQVVGVAANGREALAKVMALRPDIVLMDINLRGDMDGLQATEMITRQTPVCVVMMSVQSELEYATRAMMVGARGYLVKPFTTEELVNTIRIAARSIVERPSQAPAPASPGSDYPPQPARSLKKIVAVYSPKGGVGRSVLAVNLAIMLKRQSNARVVLVDANLQSSDAHVLLNITTSNSIDDLREAGALDQDIVFGTIATHESGIGLLRAPVAIESAELFTTDAMKTILVELQEHFDYIVIDTDTTFSEYTLTVLDMADIILLVTTLEMSTLNRVSQFFDVMDRLNYTRSKVKLVCNRVDPLYGIQPKHVESRFRQHFLALVPDEPKLVVNSVDRGVPFVLSQKAAPITKTMQKLADRVILLLQHPQGDDKGPEKQRWGRRG